MDLLNKNCAMAKNWLAFAAVIVLVLSNPVCHAQGPMPDFACFIGCGVKVIQCAMGCLSNPICFLTCGMNNLNCISSCKQNHTIVAEYPIPSALFEPKSMAAEMEVGTLEAVAKLMSSAGAIGENGIKGSLEEMAKIIASVDIEGNGQKGSLEAMAKITSFAGSIENDVTGSLQFRQDSTEKATLIKGRIIGLSPGIHGLSIHSTGNCDSVGARSKPVNKVYGTLWDENHYSGDLGNIVAGPDGIAEVSSEEERIQLVGENPVLGQAVFVHGNSGAAVGCGTIEIKTSI
ncbi:OLC1v1005185C1 [Oldenlandia corymbosa var. corymbosa]|uniref:OLC1v1005185C1 n=1 Tax=Oldenlandia corymbosa var. corymbosa TaxID=529605 RepID=A0AAV1DE10_OLDCO|nr:OLC1v1005185C1 [Oldenlandia corymbosa var. corymbosa]